MRKNEFISFISLPIWWIFLGHIFILAILKLCNNASHHSTMECPWIRGKKTLRSFTFYKHKETHDQLGWPASYDPWPPMLYNLLFLSMGAASDLWLLRTIWQRLLPLGWLRSAHMSFWWFCLSLCCRFEQDSSHEPSATRNWMLPTKAEQGS